jgi:hypothetical protein
MNIARIVAAAIVLTFTGAAGLSAFDFDFGGSLDNSSTPSVSAGSSGTVLAMDQRNKAALWGDMHFGPSFALSAQGSYSFTLLVPYLFDIDFLKADWQILPALKASAGRFVFSDFTGHVLNHKLDGLALTASFPFAVVTAGAGYSGFLLKPSSLILMTRTDSGDQSDSSVFFAAPRIIEKVDVLFPNILPRQDLEVVAILQQDLRAENTLIQPGQTQQLVAGASGGRLSSQFWGIGLSGGLVSTLYYDSWFYVNTGSTLSYIADPASITGSSWEYASILAFFGGVGFRYFDESLLSSRVELQAIVSSGDADNATFQEGNTAGESKLLVPISQDTLGIAFQPQWGNLILIDANYSLKPFSRGSTVWQNLQLMAKVLSFLRPTTGAISQAGLNPSSTDLYLGTEGEVILNFRPFSDLGTALSFACFIPNPNAFTGTAAQPVLAGRLEVSFSF